MSDDAIMAFSRLNDLLGKHVPESERTSQAYSDFYTVLEALKELKVKDYEIGYLESIASSILHGHEQSVVDWDAFKALDQYFKARENSNDH